MLSSALYVTQCFNDFQNEKSKSESNIKINLYSNLKFNYFPFLFELPRSGDIYVNTFMYLKFNFSLMDVDNYRVHLMKVSGQ